MYSTALVGYTGFVGSNLMENYNFTNKYNSKNIEEAFGTKPDLLIYSGIPAEKFLANKEPEKDLAIVNNAIENIKKINPKKLVLISTVDVYKESVNVDEASEIITEGLQSYGLNRYYIEKWVEENFQDYLIVRLPGLYGNNIKKNFIYDLIKVIPAMLTEAKFKELCEKDSFIKDYYYKLENSFYKCKELREEEIERLKVYFEEVGFSALNFTDSRGLFQFYNLKYLYEHIDTALKNGIRKLNLATEPITVEELYLYIKGEEFKNPVAKVIPTYDFKTKHYEMFKGTEGYIMKKDFILEDIKAFVEGYGK